MTSLAQFGLSDMVRVGAALRAVGAQATSMEDSAQQIVSHLYEQLLDESGAPTCALARQMAPVAITIWSASTDRASSAFR